MAGLGSSWGSRDEFLHPRDRHGRFRKKWQMAAGVIDAISSFLEKFSPRTFQSDGQSAQYLFNRAKPGRFGGGTQYSRLHADYDEAQEHLRSGDIDAPTQKFVKMMDDAAVDLDSDIIVSQTMGPEAFGLTPETMNLEDGGVEDFTGRLVADRGYRAVNIGTPLSHGPGKITMTIAVGKGTKAIIPARSQNDRGMFLDRDQELRITKVKSDGRGGYYMMAVATPRTPGETPEPIDRGPRGVGLSPQEREARILQGQQRQAKREGIRTDAEINQEQIDQGTQQVKAEQPTQQTPAPSAPGEPPPRNEPVVTEALGGPDTQGKGTAEIAQTPPPEVLPTPGAPTPEVPAPPAPDIRRAVREAGIPSPSEGHRRREWNNAYLGVASGKKHPEDMLRELESDIKRNRGIQEEDKTTGRQDPSLADDIKAQDQLADAIAKEYGLQRAQGQAPAKKAAPGKVTPISQAGGERRRELPGEAGGREVTSIKAFKATKAQQIQDREERKRRILAPEPEAPPPVAPKKATLAKVLPIKKAAPAAPAAPPTELPETTPGSGKVRMSQLREGVPILVEQGPDGKWRPATKKTGATRITVQEVNQVSGRGGQRQVVGTDEQGNRVEVESRANVQTFFLGNAPAKKAAPAKQQGFGPREGPDVIRGKTRATALKPGDRIMVETDSEGNVLPEMVRGDGRPATIDKVHPDGRLDITEVDGKKVTTKGQESGPGAQMPYYRKETATEARRVAKKAAPAAPEPGAAPDLDKMTKAELLEYAKRPEISAGAKTSMTKDQIKERIRSASAQGPATSSPEIRRTRMQEAGLDVTVKELQIIANNEGVPRRGRPTNKAALQGAILANRAERANASDSHLLEDLADGIGIKGDAGGLIPARQLDLNQGMSELEVADRIFRDADQLEASPMPAPGSDKVVTKAMQDQRDKAVADLRDLATRLRAHGSPPVEPNAPAAQKPIVAPDRREAFGEDWLRTPSMANIHERTAAGRSILEVRDDVAAGRITPDEGIRRLENDIELNKSDLAEVEQELRGDQELIPRMRLKEDREKLRKAISDQENASSFLRKHFRNAPAITPDEVKVQLDDKAVALMEAATPDQVREAGRIAGFGELKGNTKDELLQDLLRKVAGKELESRAAKKAAPKKLAPAPLEPKKATTPGHVDARLLAEGLEMDESDSKMLAHIQDMLDGTNGQRANTPAAAGRYLEKWANGPAGPAYRAAVISGVNRDREGNLTPELQGEYDESQTRFKRWMDLADRLQKTRRPSAKKAAPPAPSTKLTPEEKKTTKAAAELLDVPAEKLQAQVVAKRAAAAPPSQGAQNAVDAMKTMNSTEEGHAFLKNRTKAELQEIAKASNAPYESRDTKATLIERIVGLNIGARVGFEAFRKDREGSSFRGETTDMPQAPGLPQDNPRILARLNARDDRDVPVLSREQAADLVAPLKKARLVELAKTYSIPSPNTKTMTELRREIVDASVGRRLDSIAIRGFTGSRPGEPEPVPLENMSPAELANLEGQLGIKRTSLDRADRIRAILAKQAADAQGPSVTRSLPASGRKWNWTTIQEDGGTMHGDSASMNLAQKLRKAGREDDAQYVADMRWRISNTQGEHSPDDVEKMVKDLKAMMAAEQDPSLKAAYARALQDIEAPESPAPELPASTPQSLRKMMDELNQIPVARRTGHFAGTTKSISAVDRLADLIRKTETGEAGSLGSIESEIRRILRSFHESVDGAYQMWRLEDLIKDPDFKTWVRDHYPKT